MTKKKRRKVLTTGQVAKICDVAPRTVSKWFDAGHLRGYRIPGSKDRRIPVEQLLRFMRTNGMPTTGLDIGAIGILVVDDDEEWGTTLCGALEAEGIYDATIATSAFEAGVLTEKLRPAVIVMNISLSDIDPKRICQAIRKTEHLSDIALIAVSGSMTEGKGQGLIQEGFAGFLRKPFEAQVLHELVEQVTELE